MSKEVQHSIILIFVIGFTFVLARTPLIEYQLQLSAGIFIIYFLLKKLFSKQNVFVEHKVFDASVFTFVIISIVNSTGDIASPLFFLNFFLIFALTLLLEPVISITSSLTLIIMYLLSLPENQSLRTLIPLLSLPFLSPFALFLGEEYQKVLQQKKQIKLLKEKNAEIASSVGKNKKETFLFLTVVLKDHLKTIEQAAENFQGEKELSEIKNIAKKSQTLINEYESDI